MLLTKKVIILNKYLDFIDFYLKELLVELPKRSDINKHAINLELGKQPSYELIYNLELVELETLKTYIKSNLANSFIQPFISSARAFIFLV